MALEPEQIKSLVDNLQRLYGFGIALAFREALRKFCYKEEGDPASAAASRDNTEINWLAWPEALSFMITAGVFFHGMNRFFEKVYVQPGIKGPLATTLGQFLIMVDFGVFFLEALIISVAALRLTDRHYRFFAALLCLFGVDLAWATWWVALQLGGAVQLDAPVTYNFLWLDLGVVVAYAAVYAIYARTRRERRYYHPLFFIMTLLRTLVDYWLNWHVFYFG